MSEIQWYDWQHKALFEKENDYALWCAEAGTGKSFAGVEWQKQKNRGENPVVFCIKQIEGAWLERMPNGQVFTPHSILKKELPENPTSILIDEIDAYASPLFLAKKRSQCAAKLYEYIRNNPQAHVLGMSATPIRSTPWNLHTILTYLHRYIEWKEYRAEYFYMDQPRYMNRPAYFPKPGWQKYIQTLLETNAEIALLNDVVPPDKMPEESHIIRNKFKKPNYEKNPEWEAAKQFHADNLLEQSAKDKTIAEISRGYRKIVLVVYRTGEVARLYKKLSKERQTFVVDGGTKDVHAVELAAEDCSECYLIVQASVGAGFEVPSFPCMIFVSQSYGVRNYTQMKGRIRRANDLIASKGRKKLDYFYLHGGKCDKMIYESIQSGRDFVPSEYQR